MLKENKDKMVMSVVTGLVANGVVTNRLNVTMPEVFHEAEMMIDKLLRMSDWREERKSLGVTYNDWL